MGAVRRPYWYEDDVVEYTSSGKFPKIPEKYKICDFSKNRYHGKLKAFRTKEHANCTLCRAVYSQEKRFYKNVPGYTIFRCDKCGMYHIVTDKNYNKILGIPNIYYY